MEAKELKEVEKISNVYNLNTICRIKERQGLWAMITYQNKAGMIGFKQVGGEKKCFAPSHKCESLGLFVIYRVKGQYTLGEVLDNMFDLKTENVDFFKDKNTFDIMGKVAPDYDEDEFKTYQYHKIYKWFEILYDSLELDVVEEIVENSSN